MAHNELSLNRRSFLAGGAWGGAKALAGPTTPSGKPNIIFFMVDQLSAKWLWGPANKAIHTPNFDKLRAGGVAFTSACVSNPICCASRATLATGLATRGHGVLQNGYQLDPQPFPPSCSSCSRMAGAPAPSASFTSIPNTPAFITTIARTAST